MRILDYGMFVFNRSHVNAEDAAKILKTPNLESIHHDKLSWNHEKNGVYSVQSGSRLSLHHQMGTQNFHRAGNWPQIWRVCRNCLPMRVRLHDRGVNGPYNCILCDTGRGQHTPIFQLLR